MRARLRSWRQKIRSGLRWLRQRIKQHPFIATGCIVALLAIIAFTLAVYMFGWDWTGFTGGESKITITSTSKGTTTATELQPGKALWDWLGLLAALAIPAAVGLGTIWFTRQQAKASDAENKDNQREAALQAYIDKISELLLKEHFGELTADGKLRSEYEQVRKIARVRTLTVLRGLDAIRKANVLQFLHESGLIDKNKRIIDLSGADLSGADLIMANLAETDLRGASFVGAYLGGANLSMANLSMANLSMANLDGADLRGANLSQAGLSRAILSEADLEGANLIFASLGEANLFVANLSRADISGADLIGANLIMANLSGANLIRADLIRADLSGTNLSGAILSEAILSEANLKDATGTTTEELEKQAKSLQDAIMPDGSKHS